MKNKHIITNLINSTKIEYDQNLLKKYTNYLINFIQQKVKRAKAKGVIFGLSGGIDSALIAALAKKAFPNNSLGIIMPIDEMKKDLIHIEELKNNLNLNIQTFDLSSQFDSFMNLMPELNKMAKSNIKPRLRMTTLYALGQNLNYLVLGTDNLDEYFIGYFTKYGDGGVDLLPISHLLKNEVKLMAKYLNVPDSIIDKAPSAGLWEGQTDENELGFKYQDLDNYLLDPKSIKDKHILDRIKHLNKISQHKRRGAYRPLSIQQFIYKKGEK
ncbi:NAD(+) synthase [Mycoplasmopsis gallinarum]|uniref:NAD(+) synthase n=1 Tax=Mycoplasmopsis gallinarum TaxID=29557 RepID=UPI0006871E8C|nr:NAD(+) synthase [Mycoplasmopsis gallinarum]